MDTRLEKLFPRDPFRRVAMAICGLVLGIPSAYATILLLLHGKARGFWGWVKHLAAIEILTGFALFFICGLIWAIATPRWLESTLDFVTKKLGIALLALLLLVFVIFPLAALLGR